MGGRSAAGGGQGGEDAEREKAHAEPVRVRRDVAEDVEIGRDHGAVLSAASSPIAVHEVAEEERMKRSAPCTKTCACSASLRG
jgi:hypothetical protein